LCTHHHCLTDAPDTYDSIDCAAGWARESLQKHEADAREHLYTLAQFEQAKTHDELWNAAQRQMVHLGKMHGFMRMYWAKKILEWTPSATEAIRVGACMCVYVQSDCAYVPPSEMTEPPQPNPFEYQRSPLNCIIS